MGNLPRAWPARKNASLYLAIAALFTCCVVPRVARAQAGAAGCTTTQAVKYVEFPEGGPSHVNGRTLVTGGTGRFGVDIDSRIDILVDTGCLRRALVPVALTPELARHASQLGERLARLDATARTVPDLVTQAAAAVGAYQVAVAEGTPRTALLQVRRFEAAAGRTLDALHGAIVGRLVDERATAASAGGRHLTDAELESSVMPDADRLFDPIVAGPHGYDFAALRDRIASEVASAQRELALLPDPAIRIAIEAYLVSADGRTTPINLPHYNSAPTGAETRFTRVEFAVTPEQAALYERYSQLAKSLGESQSLGAAAMQALRQQLEVVRSELGVTLDSLDASLTRSQTKLVKLSDWSAPEARAAWFATVRVAVANSANGATLSATWDSVSSTLDSLQRSVEAVRALANIRTQLAMQDPVSATNLVLSTASALRISASSRRSGEPLQPAIWKARAELLRRFIARVGDSEASVKKALEAPGGPIADLADAGAAADDLQRTLLATSASARSWLVRAIGSDVAQAVADLPTPPGQQYVPLAGDVNTSMNLRTIPVKRSEGDLVQVSYKFFSGDRPLPGSWQDELRLRAFGFLARAVAGLAFTRHVGGDNTFTPTASLSWLATYRGWPDSGATGLGTPFRWFGAGLSTMSLNFDTAQKVQIGIAGTLSTLDDRILGGYGYNLQAPDKPWFWFFSLRLFSASGSLGGQ
jgi:hypothetical protein